MANDNLWETSVKFGQVSSLDPFASTSQPGSSRSMADIHKVLGDPRISVGLPVRDELSAASNLLVNKSA
jgi:hypothetical protein